MTARNSARFAVFGLLLLTLLVTLLGRTVYLQAAGTDYAAKAQQNRMRTETVLADRGDILDAQRRPLATSKAALVVQVDRNELLELPEDGREVIERLANLLDTDFATLDNRLTPCTSENAVPGQCWNGHPYQPIPVATGISQKAALAILESPDEYPALTAGTELIRHHPSIAGARAGHMLGAVGSVTAEDIEVEPDLDPADQLGKSGLEKQYDNLLRGRNGSRTIEVDAAGALAGEVDRTQPQRGLNLVTSINADLQAVVEKELRQAVKRARANTGSAQAGDSASAVVMDVTNGRILAMASLPDYHPKAWVGGISQRNYKRLQDREALLFRAIQGQYAPGSTYKPFTVAAMADAGYSLYGSYSCPGSVTVGGRTFTNFESQAFGTIPLSRAIEVSCNTVFYNAGAQLWSRTGGSDAKPDSYDPMATIPAGFGLGDRTGIDLPEEAGGTISGRAAQRQLWQDRKDAWCAAAKEGYPQLRQSDPALAEEYTALDRENCRSGFRWRQGDAMNASIGQGLTAITPLQLATGYAALANGGTVYRPLVGKAVIDDNGEVVDRIRPEVMGKAPVERATLDFLNRAMVGVSRQGTAAEPFAGFPLDQVPVASKTGSAQVSGDKPSTSWFASYAPANDPKYAVVMMVTAGGTGSQTSGPGIRAIYEAIFGVDGATVDPAASVLRRKGD